MSKINDLIRELCPDGINFYPLSEVAQVKKGTQVNKDAMSHQHPYPVYNGGVGPSGNHTESNFPANTITVSQGGASAGYVNFVTQELWVGAHCYAVIPSSKVDNRFLYFSIKSQEASLQRNKYGAGIPALDKSTLQTLRIPTPPIEIQREIVSILDKFTQLEAQLEAELEARRTQYEVTRDRLLDFSGDLSAHPMGEQILDLRPEGVIFRSIGEVTEVNRGSSISKLETTEGNVPVIAGGQKPAYWHSEPNRYGENVVVAGSGAYAGFVSYWNQPIWASDSFTVTGLSKLVLTKFVFYWLKNMQQQLHSLKRGSGVPHVYAKDVAKILIAVPPLEIQKEIISILDKLDDLVNDISYGLPAEIAARRKQYEHYRNKLLSFKELDAA